MKLCKIAKKEFLQNIRDIKIMMIMTIVPLVIIFLLGLINYKAADMNEIYIEYSTNDSISPITEGLLVLFDDFSQSAVFVNESKDPEQSKLKVQANEINIYMTISEENQMIEIFKNATYNSNSAIVESLVATYIENLNVQYVLNSEIYNQPQNFVSTSFLNKISEPGMMDYFAIVMCVLFVFYSMPIPVNGLLREKREGTFDRMLASGISRLDMLLGKTLGYSSIAILQVTVVMLVTLFVYKINWGNHLILTFIFMYLYTILIIAIGIFLGMTFKNEAVLNALIHTFIALMAFFGGSYMPLQNLGWMGQIGKYFSPIWWQNYSLLSMIYNNTLDMLLNTMFYYLVGITILLTATWLVMNRRVSHE